MRVLVSIAAVALIVLGASTARADSCLGEAGGWFGLGAGTHYRAGDSSAGPGFAADAIAMLASLHVRVACHVGVGGRVAVQTDFSDALEPGTSKGVIDLTPQVAFGARAGAWFAHLAAGPAVYAADRAQGGKARGIGLGADVIAGYAIEGRFHVGLSVVTTLEPARPAVDYLLVFGGGS